MMTIAFPPHDHRIRTFEGRRSIFDPIRKQWVILTPEEWVRQNFIQYLLQTLKYPAALIGVEKEITLGEMKKRSDITVFDRNGAPWMIIECKAMYVPLNSQVLDQVLRYNQTLQSSYVVITNGSYTKGFQLIPELKELLTMPDPI